MSAPGERLREDVVRDLAIRYGIPARSRRARAARNAGGWVLRPLAAVRAVGLLRSALPARDRLRRDARHGDLKIHISPRAHLGGGFAIVNR